MRGTRILRYVGNREKPEESLYDPLERMIDDFGIRSQADFALGGDLSLFINIPDLVNSGYEQRAPGCLFTPEGGYPIPDALFSPSPFWGQFRFTNTKENPKPKPEVDFEVNMMEALVGWKSWYWDSGSLKSNSGECIWHPDVATEAKCEKGCEKIPAEHHTCGIYGAEKRETAEEYAEVIGQVSGWGRYVRYSGGWKAQFAYPRCFYLRADQMNLLDGLKKYHVPIYVSQPIQFYDPAEEGFDGHWNQEENGDSRTDQEPFAGEEGSDDEED